MLRLFTKWGNTASYKEGSKNVEIQDNKTSTWTRFPKDIEDNLKRFLKQKEKATTKRRQQLRDHKSLGSGFKF